MLKIQNRDSKHEDGPKIKDMAKNKTVETLSGLDQAENRAGSLKKPKEVTESAKQTLL